MNKGYQASQNIFYKIINTFRTRNTEPSKQIKFKNSNLLREKYQIMKRVFSGLSRHNRNTRRHVDIGTWKARETGELKVKI